MILFAVLMAVQLPTSPSVMMTGEVGDPGKIMLAGPPLLLLEAIALAGAPTTNAGDEVIISHRPKPGAAPEFVTINLRELQRGVAGLNVTVQDGDIINLPVVKRYAITGAVRKPGSYPLHAGLTMAQAIVLAGGLARNGSDKDIQVTRLVDERSVKPAKIDAGPDDKVLPKDEIRIGSR